MDEVFARLTAWLSPITPFTMDEAWSSRFPDAEAGANSARVLPTAPAQWQNDAEAARWAKVQQVRRAVNAQLEITRNNKEIGGSLDALVKVAFSKGGESYFEAFDGLDVADVFITSQAQLRLGEPVAEDHAITDDYVPTIHTAVVRLHTPKCARSWRRVPDVGLDADYPDLSARDADAVRYLDGLKG